jgi:hypothetical protein
MQCKEFAAVVELDGLSPLLPAAQDHLASCDVCQNFLADLSSIVAVASQFSAEADPPQRIWVSLRAQLEAEGLLKDPAQLVPEARPSWLQQFGAWFTPRTLATAGVGVMLAIAAFLTMHKPAAQVANAVVPIQPQLHQVQKAPPVVQSSVVPPPQLAPKQHSLVKPPLTASESVSPTPTEELYSAFPATVTQFENELPQARQAGNPAVDDSLRKNLRTVNEFIKECEKHLKKYPQDMLAREYLNSAYQQKAELIAALLDSGRSEQ